VVHRFVQRILEFPRNRRPKKCPAMSSKAVPVITGLEDSASMRRDQGELVAKAVRPNVVDKAEYLRK
jgi:hypothetical protein